MFYTLFDDLKIVLIFNIELLTYAVQLHKITKYDLPKLIGHSSIEHSAAVQLLRG